MKNKAVKKLILFFDSGLGGLTTLLQAEKLLPNENFVYICDSKNSPYGNLSKKQIKEIIFHNVSFFCAKYNPKAIVLACNTITSVAINDLRHKFPNLIIIGAEPAIRPAIQSVKNKILVLGTKATLAHSALVKLFKANNQAKIIFYPLEDLASLVDEFFLTNTQIISDYLKEKLSKFNGKVDGVVLGCTHYVIVKKEIKKILGNVTLFNGNLGIAKRLKQCLGVMNLLSNGNGAIKLVSTDFRFKTLLLESYTKLLERRDEICVV